MLINSNTLISVCRLKFGYDSLKYAARMRCEKDDCGVSQESFSSVAIGTY